MIILLVIVKQIYMLPNCIIVVILLALRMPAILMDPNYMTYLFDFDDVHLLVLPWSWIRCSARVSYIVIYDTVLITGGIAYGKG